MSASALSALVKDMKDNGVPELSGRSHITEAKTAEIAKHDAYGPLLQEVEVQGKAGPMSVELVNLLTLLFAAYSNCLLYTSPSPRDS